MADTAAPPSECDKCSLPLRWGRLRTRPLRTLGQPAGRSTLSFWIAPIGSLTTNFTEALGDPQRPKDPTRPWLRLFQLSYGFPWRLPWRHVPVACAACSQEVTFGVWTIPRYDIRAHSMVCLACGQTTVEHVYPGHGQSGTPVTGREWAPPCVAVARLRRAIFTQSPIWAPPPRRISPEEDDND